MESESSGSQTSLSLVVRAPAQKAPAANIDILSKALLSLFDMPDHPIKIIGTRHGEKLFETLLSREEMSVARDLGNFFMVSPDDRDLNYDKFFKEIN